MKYLVFSFMFVFLVRCANETQQVGDIEIMDSSLKNSLKELEKAKIFFGHQSVGFNVMNGVEDLITEANNQNINLISVQFNSQLSEFYFAHSAVGKNREPKTKCKAFSSIITGDFAKNLDIAVLKFCYVDFSKNTDIIGLFNHYKETVNKLENTYPNLSIVHVTAPLRRVQKGWKANLKEIMGKNDDAKEKNIVINKYNNLVRENFKQDSIFDLARMESTYPDGSRETFEMGGSIYFALIPDYTFDGGHLNNIGRNVTAKELLRVLANTMHKRQT